MPLNKETKPNWRNPYGVIVKVLDCNYYVHLQILNFGKGMNSLIPTAMG